jgi:hypothetical protein
MCKIVQKKSFSGKHYSSAHNFAESLSAADMFFDTQKRFSVQRKKLGENKYQKLRPPIVIFFI